MQTLTKIIIFVLFFAHPRDLEITDSELIRKIKRLTFVKFDGVKIFISKSQSYSRNDSIFISCDKLENFHDFIETLFHELNHISHPELDEGSIKELTKTLIPESLKSSKTSNPNFDLRLELSKIKSKAKFLLPCF